MQTSTYSKVRVNPWSVYPGAIAGWVMDAFNLSMMFLLVPVIADLFFPAHYGLAIIGTWSIYTTTFIFRPVGGLIFGRLGDRIGRKNTMTITLLGLGLITFATGFLPVYSVIGIAAPLLLFLFRIITGIFAGGEYGNGSSILMETVGAPKRGIWGAAIQSGYPLGYTLAAVIFLYLHYVFPGTEFAITGWRWMFWIGIIPAIIGLVIRLKMPESAMWIETKDRAKKLTLSDVFKNRRLTYEIITSVLAMTGIAWVYGLTLGFFPTVLSFDGFLKFPYFLYVVITAILVSLLGYLSSGYLSDHIGRRTVMVIYSILAIIFSIPLTFLIIKHYLGFSGSLIFASIIAFLTTGIYGVIPSFLSEKYPTEVRSTGTGIGFNGGFILGNWSTVFLLLIVSFTSPFFFGWWGIFVIIGELFIFSSALLSKETRGLDLSDVKL
ncbi:metabolite transporter [Thermoplasma volcanium GSS1]|uniref:Metabolite transporter n=1 Tax=Thermoplasma volcanium (strain ATCC 51530 / DSM 4299 / JCM 9571 / NBRC 15438 / GSS1) TaxID=273116 RepID=Q97CN2_THEVO|nr:MFS transporter [Thermoplasma volcanium]BAB59211.1 metabolite transporter [Thermoplasma volcanium GSS1]